MHTLFSFLSSSFVYYKKNIDSRWNGGPDDFGRRKSRFFFVNTDGFVDDIRYLHLFHYLFFLLYLYITRKTYIHEGVMDLMILEGESCNFNIYFFYKFNLCKCWLWSSQICSFVMSILKTHGASDLAFLTFPSISDSSSFWSSR